MEKQIQSKRVEDALLENYEAYYRLAYSYLQNREDALDAVQESACRAIRECRELEDGRYVSTWIYRIVVNTSIDLLRRRKREVLTEEWPQEGADDRYSDMDLQEMLRHLDEKSRTVILLRYFEDMKLEDIARVMDENVNTVKARLYRTLKKLRLELDGEGRTKELKGEGV